ncbi:hypothetical protein GQ473_04080 [archaeon]|nr:hypothetical protein [archaeon]
MANEAVIIELLGNEGDVVQYTVAAGTAITKGTLMYLSSDPRTILATSAQGQIFVGIASTDKTATDGATKIGVYTNGIFDLTDSSAGMTLGDICKIGGANLVATSDEAGALATAEHVGLVLETAAANEVVAVKIRK